MSSQEEEEGGGEEGGNEREIKMRTLFLKDSFSRWSFFYNDGKEKGESRGENVED